MSITEKLGRVNAIKRAIQAAISDKGVPIGDNTPFADYPGLISSIGVGSGPIDKVPELISELVYPDDFTSGKYALLPFGTIRRLEKQIITFELAIKNGEMPEEEGQQTIAYFRDMMTSPEFRQSYTILDDFRDTWQIEFSEIDGLKKLYLHTDSKMDLSAYIPEVPIEIVDPACIAYMVNTAWQVMSIDVMNPATGQTVNLDQQYFDEGLVAGIDMFKGYTAVLMQMQLGTNYKLSVVFSTYAGAVVKKFDYWLQVDRPQAPPDILAPVFQTASINNTGTGLMLIFNEDIVVNQLNLSLKSNGIAIPYGFTVAAQVLTLKSDYPFYKGDVYTLDYVNGIYDQSGNQVTAKNWAVTNNSNYVKVDNPIKRVFDSGVTGLWYDLSDFSRLFQDAAGTIPVTAVGQTVARINARVGEGRYIIQSAAGKQARLQQDPVTKAYYLLSDGIDDGCTSNGGLAIDSPQITVFLPIYMSALNTVSLNADYPNITMNYDSMYNTYMIRVSYIGSYPAKSVTTLGNALGIPASAVPLNVILSVVYRANDTDNIRVNGYSQIGLAKTRANYQLLNYANNLMPAGRFYGYVAFAQQLQQQQILDIEKYFVDLMGITSYAG